MDDLRHHHDVAQLLMREARLVDERRFEEWLALWTADAAYVVPTRHNRLRSGDNEHWVVDDELDEFFHVHDDKFQMMARVMRLGTGLAWAEDPPSRTRHLVGNVEILGVEGDETRVHSTLFLWRSRLEDTHPELLTGGRYDTLRSTAAGLRIARRRVVLDATVLPMANLTVPL
jgi:3-phenylpropionate/cinnamic acid dioxygenase small subunit